MSVSGIGASPELLAAFTDAVNNDGIRVLKVAIVNEALVPDQTWPKTGDLKTDFEHVQDYVEDNVPAYLLVRLDSADWLSISYVPETAKIRDKMLYASTQGALKKALGENRFKDSLFATSKADLTPEAYDAHVQHMLAPKPLSAREAEMAGVRAAERAAGATSYEGMRAKKSHMGAIGLKWTEEAESAVKALADAGAESALVLLSVDMDQESLVLKDSAKGVSADQVGQRIPADEPSFALYSWPHQNNQQDVTSIVLIYCCPASSPIKQKMVYSAEANSLRHIAKGWGLDIARKAETSDPTEINEAYLMLELGHDATGPSTPAGSERVAFAKPRGPPRRR